MAKPEPANYKFVVRYLVNGVATTIVVYAPDIQKAGEMVKKLFQPDEIHIK